MDELLSKTEYVLKEAKALFNNVGVLWSGGKDSTALLHIIANTFDEFPFKVIHLVKIRNSPDGKKAKLRKLCQAVYPNNNFPLSSRNQHAIELDIFE